jgi:hypothetical protein
VSIIVTRPGQPTRRIEAGTIPLEASFQDFIVANPEALPLDDLHDDLQQLFRACPERMAVSLSVVRSQAARRQRGRGRNSAFAKPVPTAY